jgi:urocanate hydratase
MQDHDAKTPCKPMCAPRGQTLSCKGWAQEAAMRMLMNSLDPEVAESEQDLILYGGHYKATRNLACFNAIVASLRELEDDQTLVVHAGKPIGVFKTSVRAPRLIIANSFPGLDLAIAPNLPSVPHPPENAEQPAIGSWMYVGTQSVLQDTFEIFAALARQHFAGSLAGRLVVGGGMGALGGAQALAASLHGAAFLGIDPDPARIKRRLKTGYCDVMVNDLDEALRILKNAVRKREAASVALIGNCAAVIPELALRGVVPDLLTSQIINPNAGVAADPGGYIPQNLNIEQATDLRQRDLRAYREQALDSIAAHVRGLLKLRQLGSIAFEFMNGLLALAYEHGVHDAFDIPTLVSGKGTFPREPIFDAIFNDDRASTTWAALSGEPADIARIDRLLVEMFPDDGDLQRWLSLARRHVRFQGLPARTCRLTRGQFAKFARALTGLVVSQELKAPIVIGEAAIMEDEFAHGARRSDDGVHRAAVPSGDQPNTPCGTPYGTPSSAASSAAPSAAPSTPSGADTGWSTIGALLNAVDSASWVTVDDNGSAPCGAEPRVRNAFVVDGTQEILTASDWLDRVMPKGSPRGVAEQERTGLEADFEAANQACQRLVRIPMP